MDRIVANEPDSTHLARLDVPRRQAKAGINFIDVPAPERVRAGQALARAIKFLGLDDKEAADLIGIDRGQLSRWISGKERLHLDRILDTRLHGPFVIACAEGADGVSVDTVVTIRRTA